MIKVLIYWNKSDIRHSGGPAGYLIPFRDYNHFKHIKLYFLDDIMSNINSNVVDKKSRKSKFHSFVLKVINKLTFGNFSSFCYAFTFVNLNYKGISACNISFRDFDIVIFHSCLQLFSVRNLLMDYKGKVILQSHSPKPQFQELIYDSNNRGLKFGLWLNKRELEKSDKYSFERADYIIFPCKEAEEPYYNLWRYYKNNRSKWSQKFKYLLTVNDPVVYNNDDFIDLRLKYKIPSDSIIFCFIGRHASIKGYDVLKYLGKKYRNRNDIFFVVGGFTENKVLHYSNWIEMGFVNNVAGVLKEVDYCLNLNKQTYFDLGTLEYLSLGKNVILSETGGNKVLISLFDNLVTKYNSKKDLIAIIDGILSKRICSVDEGIIVRRYNQIFSIPRFMEEFEKIMISLK